MKSSLSDLILQYYPIFSNYSTTTFLTFGFSGIVAAGFVAEISGFLLALFPAGVLAVAPLAPVLGCEGVVAGVVDGAVGCGVSGLGFGSKTGSSNAGISS